jgi:hypothetical protein
MFSYILPFAFNFAACGFKMYVYVSKRTFGISKVRFATPHVMFGQLEWHVLLMH